METAPLRTPREEKERSPWALVCILCAVIIFGVFWMLKEQRLRNVPASAAPTSANASAFGELKYLQASAADVSIPSFSEAF
jgi:hypothetical protein